MVFLEDVPADGRQHCRVEPAGRPWLFVGIAVVLGRLPRGRDELRAGGLACRYGAFVHNFNINIIDQAVYYATKEVQILGESEEVIWRLFYDLLFATPRVRVELQVILIQVLVEFEEGGLVVAAVAVVRRTEDRADIVIML